MQIITHRGLDPSINDFPIESTREAFVAQLNRGYGLEFDIRFSKDNAMIVSHDNNLKRISGGTDTRDISEIDSAEISSMDFHGNHLITAPELLDEIEKKTTGTISAIHLKKSIQSEAYIDRLIAALSGRDLDRFILFDATIEIAKYIKSKNPNISIAASVSHPYDIERYNKLVGETLYSLDELCKHRDLFNWAWLDEWDLADRQGGKKKLLTQETFARLRKAGFKIALVTPELHATSPGLLGGEKHEDAYPHETRWVNRMEEIVALSPDLVCTDYSDEVNLMI